MKKLLFAIAGAAAFSAFAADPAAGANDISIVGFENYTADQTVIGYGDDGQSGGTLWSCAGDDASLVKTLGGDNAAVPAITEPRPFAGETNTKYLALDTNGSELQRAIPAAGQTIAADGTYIDTLVQFTPSESAPTADDLTGAKLAIWLGVDSEHNTTNLCVAGGFYEGAELEDGIPTAAPSVSPKTYKLSGTYDPSTWYRLTVKAIKFVEAGGSVYVGFQISIDGTPLTTDTAAYDSNAMVAFGFMSAETSLLTGNLLVPSAYAALDDNTLTAVGFKGTGALDDFVVTTEAPTFTPAGGDDYKVVIDDSDVVITPQAGDLAALAAAGVDTNSVAAVNEALATPIPGGDGVLAWQAAFLGVEPTTNGLKQVAIKSVSFDAEGKVVVEMADGVTLKTGRGVTINLILKGSDDLSTWTTLQTATDSKAFTPVTPALGETKKFYKVVVEFAAPSQP